MPAIQAREDYGSPYGFDDTNPTFLFPASPRLSVSVPDALRREWEEARKCFSAKAFSACVVMVRRTVEGTCADHGAKERTLEKSLRVLIDDGRIDKTLAEWAEALRILGNQGAHFTGDQVSPEDAADSLAFAEALLDHLYVLRKRFDEFKARRAVTADATSSAPSNP
jgi:Domain of unknown function (DUF4145)